MAIAARGISRDRSADRRAVAVWFGILWLGMLVGFGVDLQPFLRQKPAVPGLVYWHAAVFVAWLVLVSVQVALVLSGRLGLHQRVGRVGATIAVFMVPLGLATALTVLRMEPYPPAALALNLVDLLGFIVFVGLGIHYRREPDAHKRLMMLAMVSIADPGFSRAVETLVPDPKTPLGWFVSIFYGNVLLVAAMVGWDLWRRRRVHPVLLVGGISLLGAELLTAFVYFDPAWQALAARLVHAWRYTGGMP